MLTEVYRGVPLLFVVRVEEGADPAGVQIVSCHERGLAPLERGAEALPVRRLVPDVRAAVAGQPRPGRPFGARPRFQQRHAAWAPRRLNASAPRVRENDGAQGDQSQCEEDEWEAQGRPRVAPETPPPLPPLRRCHPRSPRLCSALLSGATSKTLCGNPNQKSKMGFLLSCGELMAIPLPFRGTCRA